MPLPKPRAGESRAEFVGRCMGDPVMRGEFPDGARRSAVCHAQYDRPVSEAVDTDLQESVGGALGEADSGGKLDLVLMREGRSKNGVNWGPVLDKVARLSVGRPLQALEFSTDGFRKKFDHMIRAASGLPGQVRAMLPDLFQNTTLGVITEARVEGEAPNRLVRGRAELRPDRTGFRWLLEKFKSLGQSLPGVSIFVRGQDYDGQPDAAGLTVKDLRFVSHYDVATYPSAGGGIQAVLESAAAAAYTGGQDMKLFETLLRLLPDQKDALTAAVAESDRDGLTLDKLKELAPDVHQLAHKVLVESGFLKDDAGAGGDKGDGTGDGKQKAGAGGDGDGEGDAAEAGGGMPGFLKKKLKKGAGGGDKAAAESVEDRLARVEATGREDYLRASLAESTLPDWAQDMVREQFSGTVFEREAVDKSIGHLRDGLAKKASADSPAVGDPIIESGLDGGDKAALALEALLTGQRSVKGPDGALVESFKGIRHAYQIITGDLLCEGRDFYRRKARRTGLAESYDWEGSWLFPDLRAARGGQHQVALAEAINTGAFPLILGDVLHKRMQREFADIPLDQWRELADVETVNDFQTWRTQKFGQYGTLPAVAEGGAYLALTSPTEEEVTLQVAKFGGTESLTWESIRNDNTRRWAVLPQRFAKAAKWTLHTDFFDMITGNEAIYDTNTLFHATHANQGPTSALSLANIKTMVQLMRKQTHPRSVATVRKAGVRPRWLGVPTDLVELAHEILTSRAPVVPEQGSAGQANEGVTNWAQSLYGLRVMELPHATDADNYYLFADKGSIEMACVAFLDGRQEPEIFVQNMPNVGTWFDNDQQTFKVRFIYDKVIKDWRGFVDAIVP